MKRTIKNTKHQKRSAIVTTLSLHSYSKYQQKHMANHPTITLVRKQLKQIQQPTQQLHPYD